MNRFDNSANNDYRAPYLQLDKEQMADPFAWLQSQGSVNVRAILKQMNLDDRRIDCLLRNYCPKQGAEQSFAKYRQQIGQKAIQLYKKWQWDNELSESKKTDDILKEKLNEIGDTEKGMHALGQVSGRAYDRMLNGSKKSVGDGVVAFNPKYGKVAQDAAYAAAGGYMDWEKKFKEKHGRKPTDDERHKFMQNYHNGSDDYGKPESERKGVVKVNESQLRGIIAESVKGILKEYGYDSYPESGYEPFSKIGESAAYWTMDRLKEYAHDLDAEAIEHIISEFGYSLKALADVGDIDNGVRGFGIKS